MTGGLVRQLGCASTYQAQIWYWDRSLGQLRYYTTLSGVTDVTWERVLDDYSEATVTFQPITGDDCCGKLRPILAADGTVVQPGLWPWAHELYLFRDDQLVWNGWVFSVTETVLPDETTDNIKITARDALGLLDRRVIHNDIMMNDDFYDLSDVADAIIRDAFEPDDPGILQYLDITPSNRQGKYSVRHWEAKAGDELRNVAQGGLDFCAIGRIIRVGTPTRDPDTPTITLRTKDFQAGTEIRIVGADAATAAVAVGETIDDTTTPPTDPPTDPANIPPPKVYYGGTDPFFGLIENFTTNSIKDETFLTWIATQKVNDGNPPPLTLSIPADSNLATTAPVSIQDLVPSTYFTASIAGTCRSLAQYMRLSHVHVTWSAGQPEAVGVTFIPQDVLATDNSGGDT
jgi:hypothetical protein